MVDVPADVSIVDDDPSVCRALRRLVQSLGVSAHSYLSAESFLESSDCCRSRCVILDVGLPGIDGLELQRRLASINPTTRVIFVTARAAELRQQACNAGAVDVLPKPFCHRALLAGVSAALQPAPGSDQGQASVTPAVDATARGRE